MALWGYGTPTPLTGIPGEILRYVVPKSPHPPPHVSQEFVCQEFAIIFRISEELPGCRMSCVGVEFGAAVMELNDQN
jgi:hypothetical protein